MRSASSKPRRPTFWPESLFSTTIALNVAMSLPPPGALHSGHGCAPGQAVEPSTRRRRHIAESANAGAWNEILFIPYTGPACFSPAHDMPADFPGPLPGTGRPSGHWLGCRWRIDGIPMTFKHFSRLLFASTAIAALALGAGID